MPEVDPLLTIAEVAAILRLTPRTVYRYITTGKLDAVRLSDHQGWRVRQSALDALLAHDPGHTLAYDAGHPLQADAGQPRHVAQRKMTRKEPHA